MFERILIANREIALRIIRAAQELGCGTVVYSEADKDGLARSRGSRRLHWSRPAKDSYLRVNRIIAAAEVSKADAIHPGYGFLTERADFAEVCRAAKSLSSGHHLKPWGFWATKSIAKKLAAKGHTDFCWHGRRG